MATSDDLRQALVQADPRLSKFNPLARILAFDDFDEGVNGWAELVGNHDGDLDTVRPGYGDFRPAQLSTCTFFDIGTHGSVDGTYALKLATRPQRHHQAALIKRLTSPRDGLVQFEAYFTFKAEQTFDPTDRGERAWDGNYSPSEADFGSFTLQNDICEGNESGQRYHGVLRYENTDDAGNLVQRWLYKTGLHPTTRMRLERGLDEVSDLHVISPDEWAEVRGGGQALCYNEVPTKINWHYLRWRFDLAAGRNVELQVNDKLMDLRKLPVPRYEQAYWGLSRLLNFGVDVRTNVDVRNFLFLDSVVISADW